MRRRSARTSRRSSGARPRCSRRSARRGRQAAQEDRQAAAAAEEEEAATAAARATRAAVGVALARPPPRMQNEYVGRYEDEAFRRQPELRRSFLLRLFRCGIAGLAPRPHGQLPALFVKTKGGRQRLVLDCRYVNQCFRRPPKPEGGAPKLTDRPLWMAEGDIMNAFYQIGIEPCLAEFFCLAVEDVSFARDAGVAVARRASGVSRFRPKNPVLAVSGHPRGLPLARVVEIPAPSAERVGPSAAGPRHVERPDRPSDRKRRLARSSVRSDSSIRLSGLTSSGKGSQR